MMTKIKIGIRTHDQKFSSKEIKIQIEVLQVQSITSTCSMRRKEIGPKSQSHDSYLRCPVEHEGQMQMIKQFYALF